MRLYPSIVAIVIALCLLFSPSVFADAGTGIGVALEATIVPGDSGSSRHWIGGGSFPSSTTTTEENVVQEETPAVVEEDIPEEEDIVLPEDEDSYVWDNTPVPPVVPSTSSSGDSGRSPWILVVAGVAVLAVVWYMTRRKTVGK